MPQQLLTLRLQILLFLLSSVAISLLVINQYLQGLYPLVLSNSIGIPAFLFSAAFLYINRNHEPPLWMHHILIIVLAAIALYQLIHYPELMTQYLYALPLFSFFCLPILNATIINLIIIVIASLILWASVNWQEWIRLTTNLCLFLGSSWCFAYLAKIKQRSLSRLSLTDPVSGVYNKRHFFHTLEREISRCDHVKSPLSIVALSIDDYQQMIDIHGRRDIDSFLASFSKSAHKMIRGSDEFFRFNDDLFIVILSDCPTDGALVLMERIKRTLQQKTWNPITELSLSTSVAGWSEGDTAQKMQMKLLQSLNKQQQTALQLAAFPEQ